MNRDQIARALAEQFSSPLGLRNPDWDWREPDGPNNPYRFERPMSERMQGHPYIHLTAEDGHSSFRVASFYEIADAILEKRSRILPAAAGKLLTGVRTPSMILTWKRRRSGSRR